MRSNRNKSHIKLSQTMPELLRELRGYFRLYRKRAKKMAPFFHLLQNRAHTMVKDTCEFLELTEKRLSDTIRKQIHQFHSPRLQTELTKLTHSVTTGNLNQGRFQFPEIQRIAEQFSKTNLELCRAEQNIEKLFYATPFPMVLSSREDNRIVAANGSFLELTGFKQNEVYGRTSLELDIWVNADQYHQWLDLLGKNKKVENFEAVIRCSYKKKLTGWLNSEIIVLNTSELTLTSFKDITSQKLIETKLESSYRSLTEILEGIGDLFFSLDPEWRFTYINKDENFFLNYDRETLIGKNIWETFPSLMGTVFHQECLTTLSQKKPSDFETSSVLGDDWYEIHINPAKHGLSVFGRNITAQKEITAALQRSNQQVISILESITEVFFSLDTNWRFTYLNKQAESQFKNSRKFLIGKRIWTEFPEFAGTQMAEQFHKALSDGTPLFYEGLSPFDEKYFQFNIYPTPEGLFVYMHDITEQKKSEAAQAQTKEQLGNILESIGDPIFVLDLQWRIVYMNQGMEKYINQTRADYIGKYVWESPSHGISSSLYQCLHQAIHEQHPIRFEEYDTYSGRWVNYNVFNHSSGLIIYIRDITQQKKAEEDLTRSHLRIATILESITDAFYSLDTKWQFTDLNKMAETIWKKDKEKLIGKNLWEEFPQLRNTAIDTEFHRAAETREPVHFEAFLPGMQCWVESHAYPGENGLTVYSRNITTRKNLEEASATERELFLITLRSIGDGVITANRDGQVILLNRTAEELTGWSYGEATGLPLSKVFYVVNEKTDQPYQDIVNRVAQAGETITLPNAILINRDLNEIIIANSCAPLRSGEGEFLGTVIVFQDITEKLKTEAELMKAQKIESLGVLAGGIAHDFNNFLAAILANIQLATIRLDKGLDARKSLDDAGNATKKASDLTKQLLTFAKGGAPVKKSVSIATLLEETTLFHSRGSNVRCTFNIPDDLCHAEVDSGQFSQVISNLVINAIQAMPKGGVIEVSAQNMQITDSNEILKPGKYLKITFKDNGAGIPEELLSKIFDPFFTTKESGSGLGLATSYSIIKKHGGHINVESKLGVGTSFFIYLPVSQKAVEAEPDLKAPPMIRSGKILVMDDEEMVRNVLCEMLHLLGFQVSAAPDGWETIRLYQEALTFGEPYQIVIMDLTIPGGMGGLDTLARLQTIDPNVRAVVSSGYANDPVMSDYKKHGFCGMVSKPFKIEELSAILNQFLT